ncbi:unnamed protein product [Orchesella dallaii]|uniref:Uncharacterized protein n=1 Tax=Orchesella dallaii TaxID=48710 RepID=A0ABP1PYB4_9HEXA
MERPVDKLTITPHQSFRNPCGPWNHPTFRGRLIQLSLSRNYWRCVTNFWSLSQPIDPRQESSIHFKFYSPSGNILEFRKHRIEFGATGMRCLHAGQEQST